MAACFRQRSTQHFRDRESVILTLKKFNWFKKLSGFKWTDFLSAECGGGGADRNEKKCSQLSHCIELIEKIKTTTISPRKKGDLESLYFDDYPFHSLLHGIITIHLEQLLYFLELYVRLGFCLCLKKCNPLIMWN